MDDLGAEQRESVGQILRGGRHLLDLINEVLDLSRIEAGRLVISLEPVALGTAVKHAIDLVSPLAAERGLLLSAGEIDPNLHVAADVQRLRQVLLNLLSNAVKYNRREGTVRVEVKELDGEGVRISVQDSGFGIPESQIERLFRPFERLNVEESGIQGTGLGLVLARALTEAMGGHVGVESEVGQGSNFWLELPIAAPPELVEPAPTPRDAAAPASGPARTVLYIEDNPSNLRLVERVLSSRKEIQLITAMHGSLGLELAEKHRPDLILLDLNLPDMVGEEVLKRLRVTPGLEKTPLVIVSADAIPSKVARFLSVGASAYLTKPFDVRNLLGVIDDLLAKGDRGETPLAGDS
jgi:CheY-like chemotaxis protein